ncbi:MAG: hypothetical protein R2828_00075 [Saprospiraceae bacterium]
MRLSYAELHGGAEIAELLWDVGVLEDWGKPQRHRWHFNFYFDCHFDSIAIATAILIGMGIF